MERETKIAVLKIVGYSLLFLISFFYFLYRTFPYNTLVDRLTLNYQRRANIRILFDQLKPYWLSGVEAEGIEFHFTAPKGVAKVFIDEFRGRVSIFPLLFSRTVDGWFEASLARGHIAGEFRQDKNLNFQIKLSVNRLSLASLGPRRRRKNTKNLFEALIAPVYGRVKLKADVKFRLRRRRRRVSLDTKSLKGKVSLRVKGLSIGSPKKLIYFPTPTMGELPIPLVRLGTLSCRILMGKGRARIPSCRTNGRDIAAELSGTIRIRFPLRYSVFSGKLKFKVKKAFLNNPQVPKLLKDGIYLLGDPKGDGYYHYRLSVPFHGRGVRFRKL